MTFFGMDFFKYSGPLCDKFIPVNPVTALDNPFKREKNNIMAIIPDKIYRAGINESGNFNIGKVDQGS